MDSVHPNKGTPCTPGPQGMMKGPSHPRVPPQAVPVANLFLTSDMRYPALASSSSTPDSVLPSLLNWAATGLGLLGPQRGSQLAESRPQPGGDSGDVWGGLRGTNLAPAPRAAWGQPHLPAPGHQGHPAASRAASSPPGSCGDTGTSPRPQTPKSPSLHPIPPSPTSLPSPPCFPAQGPPLSHPGGVFGTPGSFVSPYQLAVGCSRRLVRGSSTGRRTWTLARATGRAMAPAL